jgi:hypothetical protein
MKINIHLKYNRQYVTVCYSLAELYVKSVYFNLLGWRGCELHETY